MPSAVLAILFSFKHSQQLTLIITCVAPKQYIYIQSQNTFSSVEMLQAKLMSQSKCFLMEKVSFSKCLTMVLLSAQWSLALVS
jgi:hypothetical protein